MEGLTAECVTGSPTIPPRSFAETVSALKRRDQSWTRSFRPRQSGPIFDVGCTAAGAEQPFADVSVLDGANTWFAAADTSAGCTVTQTRENLCTVPGAESPDGCGFNGTYIVWNSG